MSGRLVWVLVCAGILADVVQAQHVGTVGEERHRVAVAASWASAAFDASYYHLRLDVDIDAPELQGWTTIVGTVASGTLDSLALDFSTSMTVDSVRSDGAAVAFRHVDDVLTLELGASYIAGERISADVFYRGMPEQTSFIAFEVGTHRNGDPFLWSLSEPYGARDWWPSKDHPSDKADSVRVTVTVPEAIRIGSNGLLRSEIHNGDGTKTYDWFSGYPIATYLVSVTGGVYDVYTQIYRRPDSLAVELGPLDLPILHYAYAGSNAFEGTGPINGWKHVIDILPLQEYWFGAYPFAAEKYGHAEYTGGGGMEHQTMSSMDGSEVGLIAHELGHQWFGDAVTMETWPHLWLNEGFATYSELLTWAAREHLTPGTYQTVFDLYYDRATLHKGTLLLQDTSSVDAMFSSSGVYAKGGMVVHMLRGVVGDEVFRNILRAYTANDTLRYGDATTNDFQRIAEQVSERDLDAFIRQWVTEGTGHPVYDVQWSAAEDESGYAVDVDISQTQGEPLSNVSVFEMPLTIDIGTASGTERFVVLNDQREQSFTFHVADEPTTVTFDPDRYILRNAEVNTGIEPPGGQAAFEVYPNPARDEIRIRSDISGRVDLYDLLGRRVKTAKVDGLSRLAISIGDLASGAYFLRFATDTGTRITPLTILP